MIKSSCRQLFKELFCSYTRLRLGIFVNRPVRTRMPVENPDLSGVVWGLGVKIPRLPDYHFLQLTKEYI
jgi:hypothetical protein